jgi:predicted transcriptional regulator
MAKNKIIFVKADPEFHQRLVRIAAALGTNASQFARDAITEKIARELSAKQYDVVRNVEEFLKEQPAR